MADNRTRKPNDEWLSFELGISIQVWPVPARPKVNDWYYRLWRVRIDGTWITTGNDVGPYPSKDRAILAAQTGEDE